MEQKDPSQLTDEELLAQAKKMKSLTTMNAVIIGFMVGITIYSIFKKSASFLTTLIPLFIAYQLINSSKNDKALKEELERRGLQ